MSVVALLAVMASVLLAVVGQTFLKIGMNRVGAIDVGRIRRPGALVLDVVRRWQVWVGYSAYAISASTWVFALSRLPLTVAYPFLGLTYVGVAVAGILVLDEWLTPAQWFGIMLVVAGVVTVALTA